ncbi:hypothetical protein RHS04_08236 [Rhizoctonia solani]|uniref:Uncharacterized protein n=1 Tax=Rhizoctonia solani TaxID=456999 RepID=A0A8H7LGS7_9AGAM|nr:hypothetical protein RHS04_08236 [Rhizoctonia solani]
MFKSLSSRSTRSVSVSSSGTTTSPSTLTTPTSATSLPPTLPPIAPTPTRDVPTICVVAATPGTPGSPIIEKRRTRTLVPKRPVIGKENSPYGESSRVGSLGRVRPKQPPTIPEQPVDPKVEVADLVARQFVASRNERQVHTMGPSSGFSFVPAPRNPSPPTRQTSYRIKPNKSSKRAHGENCTETSGGQVEAIKETISRGTRPISRIGSEVLGSLRGGTLTRGSSRAKVGSTRVLTDSSAQEGSTDENAGTAFMVAKKKSRGTLDSIRWALGDRTNAAKKAEKEKEKADKAMEKSRQSQDSSSSERHKVKLTIDTRAPPVDKAHPTTDTPSNSALSPVAETPTTAPAAPTTALESGTDSEAVTSGTEKSKWKWTIGRRRAKSPGPSLSPTSERPGHTRTMSLDVDALLAAAKSEGRDEGMGTYARRRHRTASFDLPTLLQSTVTEDQVENRGSPLPPQPLPVAIAPVDFGQEPKAIRKGSTESAETQASSGTMRRSSIANLIHGDSASNTGSLALRAMRSVRSITSIARLGGWGKGDESDKGKEKEGTLKDKKKRKGRKMPVFDEDEPTNTSEESWEAGALGRDPTMTLTATVGQPILPNLQLGNTRGDLGIGGPARDGTQEGRDWVAGDRNGSGSSSRVAPSTISFGKAHQPRMSNESSGSSNYPASSTHETASVTSSKPRRSMSVDYDSLFSIDTSEMDAGSGTLKNRTKRKQDTTRPPPRSLMGLFEVPTAPAPESPAHVEVQGVKIGKGRVRERVREFEARAEEHSSAAHPPYGTIRSVSAPFPGPIALSIGPAAAKEVVVQQDTFFQDREHALSLGRSASVPLLVESPNRPTRMRPKSEQLLRRLSREDAASISMINAANSDLSDLINRLDLSATPDSKYQLSPPVCRATPKFAQESPSKRSPRDLAGQQSLTAIVGYGHSRTSSEEDVDAEIQHVLFKGKTSKASVFTFAPDLSSEPQSASIASSALQALDSAPDIQDDTDCASEDFEQDTPRERSSQAAVKARRRAGTYDRLVGELMSASKDSEGGSDIPDELQAILTSQSEDESSPVLSSSSSLPLEPRVTRQNSKVQFQLPEELREDTQTDNEEVTFDFTGELGQLKGGSRNSFVEVLVSAFKTPALPSVGEGQLQLNLESPIRPLQRSERDLHSSEDRTPTFAQASKTAAEHSNQYLQPDRSFDIGRLPDARVSGTFDYETLMRELDEVSSAIEESVRAPEPSANRRRLHRLSTDSDRSSLFRGGRSHRRDEPTATFSFAAPPVSFHNRPYSKQIVHSMENDHTGRLSLTGELPGRDGEDSDRFARPGLGDKMFQMGAELGLPLPSIMASPANSDGSAGQQAGYEDYTGYSYAPERRLSYVSDRRNSYAPSIADQQRMSFMSYDSYLEVPGNGNGRRSSIDADSLFERRGRPSSISSVSIFGDDNRRRRRSKVFNPNFRPVSIISMQSETTGEDDTMVSMIGGSDGARVPRKSIATNLLLDASPCMRAEKRAKEIARAQHIEANRAASLSALTGEPMDLTPPQPKSSADSIFEYSPSKGRSCIPSRPFARPRPPAGSQSMADDSDDEEFSLSGGTPMPSMFNKLTSPGVGSTNTSVRKRSSGLICTAEPPDTPPLSDEEPIFSGPHMNRSKSRLETKAGNVSILAQAPPSTGRRTRTRAQEQRHRLSRSSVNLSISEDDLPRGASAFVSRSHSSADSSVSESVIVINPDAQMAEMIEMIGAGHVYSNEQLEAVTRYLALRNEAVETVARSQKIWQDTDFSRFTLSTFIPPTNSSEIKAMIDHSQSVYNEIPVEVYRRPRSRHPRSCARPSPYHIARHSFKSTMSPHTRMATESVEHALALLPPMNDTVSRSRPVPESPYLAHTGTGLLSPGPGARSIATTVPLSPLVVNVQTVSTIGDKHAKSALRPRAGSGNRSALGLGKKPSSGPANGNATGTQSTSAKENEALGTMSNNSHNLRINRPRPKGRVASGTARPSALRV